MVTHSLRVAGLPAGEVRAIPLPLDGSASTCVAQLRCLPGASAIHLVVTDGQDRVVCRGEVKAMSGETVAIHIQTGEEGELRVWSPGKAVLTLPPDARYDPLPVIPPVVPGTRLDLAFVIDGTARSFFAVQDGPPGSEPLLDRKEVWQEHVERLARFAEALTETGEEGRFTVLAFGDEEPHGMETPDFHFRYLLDPAEEQHRKFRPLCGPPVRAALGAILSTSGIDFVDALADALQACRRLPWAREARKVVMICGDSPGHSVLHPLRRGADRRARRLDVDVEAEQLHRAGIEIATLYLDPPADLGLRRVAFQKELLDGAHEQYARLASLPSFAFEVSRFEPESAAQALRSREGVLGRSAVLGELVEITAR